MPCLLHIAADSFHRRNQIMNKILLSLFTVFVILHPVLSQPQLQRLDTLKLVQASIWGGISFNGQSISVTTTSQVGNYPQLHLRKLDRNLKTILQPKQLTFSTDPQTLKGITDHKHLFCNGFHYIAFSVQGDADLYIFRVDTSGTRVGSIVTVIENTSFPTNDMFLATDSSRIFVGYFKPPSQTIIHTFDRNLNLIGQPLITSMTLPHNNVGSILLRDGVLHMFTGSIFGKRADLILTQWGLDWSPAIATPRTLIPTEQGDGNWFATGAVFHAKSNRWIIAFQHINDNDPSEAEHIDIAVFDERFSLLERAHTTVRRCYRPHLLVWDDFLYMIFDTVGSVIMYKYLLLPYPPSPINWKPFFTLEPDEGKEWVLDTNAIYRNAGVPGLSIANDGRIIFGWSGAQGGRGEATTNDFGKSFTQLLNVVRPQHPDGGFIYMRDGRTRYITEEPAPNNTPQKHRSRIISYISSDGINWARESGIRYQPGAVDDSIASVVSALQVNDTLWRMYSVGDFYRTNGTRTAISTDEGWTWTRESNGNILRRGDVDPHPVYLSDGGVRLFHRTGFNTPGPTSSGIAYTDSKDGLNFDTTTTRMIVADSAGGGMLKLDPAVMKYPNGDIACYIGAAPTMGSTIPAKLIVAWAKKKSAGVGQAIHSRCESVLVYPNPMHDKVTVSFSLSSAMSVKICIANSLGEEIAVIVNDRFGEGVSSTTFSRHSLGNQELPAGMYWLQVMTHSESSKQVQRTTRAIVKLR